MRAIRRRCRPVSRPSTRSGPAQRNLDVVGGVRKAEPLVRRDRRCVVRPDVERDRVDPVVEENAAEVRARGCGESAAPGLRQGRDVAEGRDAPLRRPDVDAGNAGETRRSRGSPRSAASRASAARTRCPDTPARRTRGPRRDRPGRAAPRGRDARRAGTGRRAQACDAPPGATSARSAEARRRARPRCGRRRRPAARRRRLRAGRPCPLPAAPPGRAGRASPARRIAGRAARGDRRAPIRASACAARRSRRGRRGRTHGRRAGGGRIRR